MNKLISFFRLFLSNLQMLLYYKSFVTRFKSKQINSVVMPLCSMFGPSSAYLNAYMQKTVKSDHSCQHATLLINLQGLENKLIKIVCIVVYSRLHIVSFQIVSFHKTSLKYESEKITKIQKIHQRENNFVCFIFETGIQLL